MNFTRKKEDILKSVNSSIWDLPSPSSISYFWNFGATLGVILASQIMTGLFLSFHYSSQASSSFSSVIEISREVWYGWILRFIHMNGASMFFMMAYLHMFRGLFFFSALHKKVWVSGVAILLMLMAISFLGYVLPWGQMSYWAVAVITNLLSVLPMIGDTVVSWVWGGFSVGAPTLNRFYSFHFILPFVLMFLILTHLIFLHKEGSSSSTGLSSNVDKIPFHPYFSVKDFFFISFILLLTFMISFFFPYILGDSVNNSPANCMQTPVHIQPEWYFLPSYAILRAMPSKTSGVISLLLSVSIFFILPMFNSKFSPKFSSYRFYTFWLFMSSFLFLMKMGSMPAEEPFVMMSLWGSVVYFSSILLLNL